MCPTPPRTIHPPHQISKILEESENILPFYFVRLRSLRSWTLMRCVLQDRLEILHSVEYVMVFPIVTASPVVYTVFNAWSNGHVLCSG